ncbi:VOC family protein [Luteimonas sp. SJ-92]|uniref:VOC family protein n=1 Tax=Luteimonas salinisoli TaxID=2752307 RepID=A0A853JF62_9GAMM|nr:VOC family protein [Luteimonas salinisoli]NZA27372.1 VOC family protein [Luteimonas salinisoli]
MSNKALVPHLVVNDGEQAIAFYEQAFGARLEAKHAADDGKRLMHAHLDLDGQALYLHDEFPEFGGSGASAPSRLGGASCTLHLEVDDADTAWARALAAGAEATMPLDNQFWGARYGQLRDPFGHMWSIGGPLKD